MFSPTSSRIIALLAGFALMASTMMGAASAQAISCNDVLSTVSLFSNQSSIAQERRTERLLLQYSTGFLNATNQQGACTLPRCIFPANRTDLFIKTTLFCNQTIVFNHGSILAIGPKVFIYPNGTRALFFPPPLGTANRRENCTLESNQSCVSSVGETNCDSCDNGNGGGAKVVTETTLFADGTQRFDLGCGQPVVTVFPNGTKTYAYGNGTLKTVQLPQIPPCPVGAAINCPVALTYSTQRLYQNGTQLLSVMGDPSVTVCSNGLETIRSPNGTVVKQQRCGCCGK